jgi:DNA repair protein SbcC/Rad50
MRIHRVEITGFEPFRGTEIVDFDAIADAGIFLIAGRTGAGKTAILDAITFALFGSVPRYGGLAGSKVRSGYLAAAELCQVKLEFTVEEIRYQVTRSPKRPRRQDSSVSEQPPQAELSRWDQGSWVVKEARLAEVNKRVHEVVRLDARQFQQVILLAQGDFEKFLVASSAERSDLLRTLFGTRRFADYADELEKQAKRLQTQLAGIAAQTHADVSSLSRESGRSVPEAVDAESGVGVLEWAQSLVAQQQQTLAASAMQETLLAQQRREANAAVHMGEAVAERQLRRSRALGSQKRFDDERAAVTADHQRIEAASRADLVWPLVERSRASIEHADRARIAYDSAEREFRALLPRSDVEATALEQLLDALIRDSGALVAPLELEKSLPERETKAQQAHVALVDFDAQSQSWLEQQDQLREQMAKASEALSSLAKLAQRHPAATVEAEKLRTSLAAATKAARTQQQLKRADEAKYEAGRGVTTASAVLDQLRFRQLGGYAAVLAQGLIAEKPCPVCGSPEHPAPAGLDSDAVTEDQLAKAELALANAFAESERAAQEASSLAERLRQEQAQAGQADVETLTSLSRQADAEVARLTEAVAAHQRLIAEREATEQKLQETSDAIERRASQRSPLVAASATAKQHFEQAQLTAIEARHGFGSVAARQRDLDAQLAATKALVGAARTRAVAEEEATSAEADLGEALVARSFASVVEVHAAKLREAEQARLQDRVAKFAAESKAVANELALPELQDLPTAPVALDALHASLADASAAHEAGLTARSGAEQLLRTLRGLSVAITARLAGIETLQQRYQAVNRLAATVKGRSPNVMKMSLEDFVLAAELEEIVKAANGRLSAMTSGRYEFRHSDALVAHGAKSGLDLKVLDAYTGESRSPQSLSGGEKFQASLALALGLAEVVSNRAGGMRLETLFIDEGFGSLSEDTLEVTMATLDNLREGGRVIGLISHVQSMKETIPAQIHVKITDGGWSTISQS